ncbi:MULTISPECIES: ribosome maturation factor [Treponema]|jgi:ribosome maturation factor RimP|uniref:Ribosome maturation factor RimP n=1 Tax=Treponema saccharophilum DSM 2985 TaxID=907348 RepID=H7EIG5_9SPIR|nr:MULTISPECIES: ribosome maturation factor [Treponema]EIC02616.1 protein of unknown function DUF150 [Treponema saccharophilum DSM 2985]MBQ5537369.1 ribosome maturation factor [Treponema sp.]BDC96181.1 ribosome maturation factor RimP [Treponema saccharophilum]
MEYIPLGSYQHYDECAKVVDGLGYNLVELKVSPQRGVVQIQAVVSGKNPEESISVNDCAKVHRVLLERLEEILGTDNVSMELSSPGMERNIKNAAEFQFFSGRRIRVFSKSASDWIGGVLVSSDSERLSLSLEDGTVRTVDYQDIAKAKFIHL